MCDGGDRLLRLGWRVWKHWSLYKSLHVAFGVSVFVGPCTDSPPLLLGDCPDEAVARDEAGPLDKVVICHIPYFSFMSSKIIYLLSAVGDYESNLNWILHHVTLNLWSSVRNTWFCKNKHWLGCEKLRASRTYLVHKLRRYLEQREGIGGIINWNNSWFMNHLVVDRRQCRRLIGRHFRPTPCRWLWKSFGWQFSAEIRQFQPKFELNTKLNTILNISVLGVAAEWPRSFLSKLPSFWTTSTTHSTFFKGQSDFQLVMSLKFYPNLTSLVPSLSLIFSEMTLPLLTGIR